jgi:hypothetical protein
LQLLSISDIEKNSVIYMMYVRKYSSVGKLIIRTIHFILLFNLSKSQFNIDFNVTKTISPLTQGNTLPIRWATCLSKKNSYNRFMNNKIYFIN